MFKQTNPYRPGAGLMPMYLAGRDADIEEAASIFDAVVNGIPVQSIIYTGLRGVGKTVLMNRLESIAAEKGIFCKHIEVEERSDFVSQIISCSQMYLRKNSALEKTKYLLSTCLDALKSLAISFDPNNQTFSVSVEEKMLYASPSLTQSLTDVFVSIGNAAQKTNVPICLFIDEIQYMKRNELSSLIAALHRANQLGYPIMMVGAGLPKIIAMLSDEKSYSERLFAYRTIGALTDEQAREAIIRPIEKTEVRYEADAVDEIVSVTKKYPFFIQQFCQVVFDQSSRLIKKADVTSAEQKFYEILDKGFFAVRFNRCTESEKRFVFAMVACGDLPCTIQNVAANLGKSVSSISTTRAQLINKGIVYAVRYKELDFTVPEFDGFIERNPSYAEWMKENGM